MDDRLQEILRTMHVPEMRRHDKGWLLRNLGIKNKDHPEFAEAITLITQMDKVC